MLPEAGLLSRLKAGFQRLHQVGILNMSSISFFISSFYGSQRQNGMLSRVPRMFSQLFPVGFTVSHHRKTRHIKILTRMRILDLGRLQIPRQI